MVKPSLPRLTAQVWACAAHTCAKLFEKSLDQKLLPWLAFAHSANQGKSFVHLFKGGGGGGGKAPLAAAASFAAEAPSNNKKAS
ncbi:hypothetical protein D7X94_06860 [Acutalibacter sp. 1XD8-33]|nr:hypothetical protein D7X94_06860 [Acutalibacter sp. 1XD8-33]